MPEERPKYSASEQGLGYLYQPRFALLHMLSQHEETELLIEKNDDLEFVDQEGKVTLASLKHKAVGGALTDLSPDFWKSVRVWLQYFTQHGGMASNSVFMLFTTEQIATGSYLIPFTEERRDGKLCVTAALQAAEKSKSALIVDVLNALKSLNEAEVEDFFGRILIAPSNIRIESIPQQILDQHLRVIRREHRVAVFERLEGWWAELMVALLTGRRKTPVVGREISDKLSALSEEYRSDNLPITFRGVSPPENGGAAEDMRIFVRQLRALELSSARIQNAVVDYYRAFAQRSSWARENLLFADEIELYEARLIEEWARFKEIIFERVQGSEDEEALMRAGRELYLWAERDTLHIRIRDRVSEPYVVRGAFQILANVSPSPSVYWHPLFLDRLKKILEKTA